MHIRYLFLLFTLSMVANCLSAQKLVIGTYTNNNLSKGIYIYNFDDKTGKSYEATYVQAGNPSYLTVDKTNSFIYSVNENDDGKIASFKYDKKTGQLTLINTQPNNGSAPCYVSLDQTGKWLFSGNYSSGNLTVHPINKNGSIGSIHQFIQHTGSSVNKERQSTPHVHCTYISNDNKYLYVPDLGLDKVMVYPFNANTGTLDTTSKSAIDIKPGGGPRHIIFNQNGDRGYLVEELSGAVNVVERKGNKNNIIQTLNYLNPDKDGAGADIHLSPDEKFLYVSQRTNSTIQIFKVDAKTGKIEYISSQSTMGNFPRNFIIHPSGRFLLAANQRSNDITIFKRDIKTGLLTYTNEKIKIDAPVCLKWIK